MLFNTHLLAFHSVEITLYFGQYQSEINEYLRFCGIHITQLATNEVSRSKKYKI